MKFASSVNGVNVLKWRMFIIYLEFTLPPDAVLEGNTIALNLMDSFATLRRVFAESQTVQGTRLLHNTEDPRIVLLEVTSSTDILEGVRGALHVPGVKTRAWAFSVLPERPERDRAQA
jgi:hypothetical protein